MPKYISKIDPYIMLVPQGESGFGDPVVSSSAGGRAFEGDVVADTIGIGRNAQIFYR
jgi:hypothetical protein